MKISEVMAKTGLTKKAIRFYEDEGLVTPDINSQNNYREYSKGDVDRLIKISLLRQIDMSINDIKKLIDEPLSINEVLKEHLKKVEENIGRLQKSKILINGIINNGSVEDTEEFTKKLRSLRDCIELEDKQKYGYIKRQLQRIFPGSYGRMIIVHFSPFLNESIDTKEKESAWIEIVNYLDEAEDVKYPEEFEKIFSCITDEQIEEVSKRLNQRIRKMIDSSPEELDNYKKEIMESIRQMQESEEFKESHAKMWNMNVPLRRQLMESGYYEKFVKNLKVISKDYQRYSEIVDKLNNDLGLKYDDKGNIVIPENLLSDKS
jgi:Predicted transcriptional regulators